MKTRLPKALMQSLLAVIISTTAAAYGTEQVVNISAGTETLVENDPTGTADYTWIKKGEGTALVTGDVTKYATILVQEGTLKIGDGVNKTEFHALGSVKGSNKEDIFVTGGKNASLIVDNAKLASITFDSMLGIGDTAGEGSALVTNGSEVDISNATTLWIGYSNAGELTVSNNSKFTSGYNNLWTYDKSTINIEKGAEMYVCASTKGYNFRVLLNRAVGGESSINVTSGGKMICHATQFVANFEGDSTCNITVDGAGSTFIQEAETVSSTSYVTGHTGEWIYRTQNEDGWTQTSGWYDKDSTGVLAKRDKDLTITYLCDDGTDVYGRKYASVDNSYVNISATNGGNIEFRSDLTYIGSILDNKQNCTNKQASFSVDKDSAITLNRMEIYTNTEITNEGKFTVNGNMALHAGAKLILNVTEANTTNAVITLGNTANFITPDSENISSTRAAAQEDATISINLVKTENKKAGSKYVLFNKAVNLSGATVVSDEVNITIENNQTIITLLEDIYVGRDPLADLGVASWGVYKSSQAFTGTLWGGRTNAVVLNTRTTTSSDDKGNVVSFTEPAGRTIAWGTAYGDFSHLCSRGERAGADYSIYGAAVGVEHQFAGGRSIGAALGYDWGKVSPSTLSSFDQESMHAAVYGRAGQWKAGRASYVAADLSAAVGNTESELPVGKADQDSLQLDARLSYIHKLTDKTSVSAFAGIQYYAQEDAAAANVELSSMQSLRTLVGAGITHAATAATTLFAEASVYNDAMRHNPTATVDGFEYSVSNPGRLGGSITAGAAYQMNDNWTLRASYSFDAARNSTEHSVNAGAVYSF